MDKKVLLTILAIIAVFVFASLSCHTIADKEEPLLESFPLPSEEIDSYVFDIHEIQEDVYMRDYFPFVEALVDKYRFYNPLITEHILIQANDWIVYELECTDYYRRKGLGEIVYDQGNLVILEKGEILLIPNERWARELMEEQRNVVLEVNIPEYKLRIIEAGSVEHEFTVRVGRNSSNFLATANRLEDLRTKTGAGKIVDIENDPDYINPVNAKIYTSTLRDDEIRTALPRIPFLHPEINGLEYGQLIHTTTNNKTLGRAYSNGCIGLSEGDMWVLYYHAPIGTRINIKYNLEVKESDGSNKFLRDIYADSLHHYESAYL